MEAINKMKSGKATRADSILPKFLKNLGTKSAGFPLITNYLLIADNKFLYQNNKTRRLRIHKGRLIFLPNF